MSAKDDGWIRIEDALPEFNVVVLVSGLRRSYNAGDGSYDDTWIPYVSEGQRTRCETGEYMESYSESHAEVTHWQPLPQPPKGSK